MSRRLGLSLGVALGVACSPPRVANVGTGNTHETSGPDGGDSGADWNDASSTSEEPPGDDGDAGGDGPRYDVLGTDKLDLPAEHGCPDSLPSTAVEGQTGLGAFDGIHAYFGNTYEEVNLVIFDHGADLDHELAYALWHGGDLDVGPGILASLPIDPDILPATSVVTFIHVLGEEQLPFMASVTIEQIEFIDGEEYGATMIRGVIEPWPENAIDGVSGPFAATHCEAFDELYPIE